MLVNGHKSWILRSGFSGSSDRRNTSRRCSLSATAGAARPAPYPAWSAVHPPTDKPAHDGADGVPRHCLSPSATARQPAFARSRPARAFHDNHAPACAAGQVLHLRFAKVSAFKLIATRRLLLNWACSSSRRWRARSSAPAVGANANIL